MTDERTILVIDDDESMRDVLSELLEKKYTLQVAATGEAGLEIVRQQSLDAAIVDVHDAGNRGNGHPR